MQVWGSPRFIGSSRLLGVTRKNLKCKAKINNQRRKRNLTCPSCNSLREADTDRPRRTGGAVSNTRMLYKKQETIKVQTAPPVRHPTMICKASLHDSPLIPHKYKGEQGDARERFLAEGFTPFPKQSYLTKTPNTAATAEQAGRRAG